MITSWILCASLDGVVDVVLDGAGDGGRAATPGRVVAHHRAAVTGWDVDPDAGESPLGTRWRRGLRKRRGFGADLSVDAFRRGSRLGFLEDYRVSDAAVGEVVQDAEMGSLRGATLGQFFVSV